MSAQTPETQSQAIETDEAELRQKEQRTVKSRKNLLGWMFLTGISLGWIVGLSVSPVIQTVLTSLLTFVATVIGVVASLPKKEDEKKEDKAPLALAPIADRIIQPLRHVHPAPVALLIAGIALAAPFGVLARTNLLLGPVPTFVRWKGLSDDEAKDIVKSAFAAQFPTKNKPDTSDTQENKNGDKGKTGSASKDADHAGQASAAGVPGLNSDTVDIPDDVCKQLLNTPVSEYRETILSTSNDPNLKAIVKTMKDPEVVAAYSKAMCKDQWKAKPQ